MNFDWTVQEQDIKTRVGQLFDTSSLAELEAMEQAAPNKLRSIVNHYLGRLAKIGYLDLAVGPEGRTDTVRLIAAQEELAGRSTSLFLSVEASARLFGGLVRGFARPDQLRDVVEGLRQGDLIAGVGLSEPAEPRESSGMLTRGRTDGQEYVVNGKKSFVTNGPIADYVATLGEVEGRLAVFIVQPGQPGLVMGPTIKTLGCNGLAVCSMELQDVSVAADRVLGPFESPSPLDFVRLTNDLILTVASVGIMQKTVVAAKAWAQSHERGGKTIFSRQEIRFKLAEMLTLSQTSQLLTYRAGWMYASSDPEAETVIRCAKVFTSEAAERVASMAMQIMAGAGYISGNTIERAFRDSKYAGVAGTTSEIARMSIAEDLLRRHV